MFVRDFLVDQYANIHDISRRTQDLYHHTLDRFADFLQREPEMEDLNDMTVIKFLKWRRDHPTRRVRLGTVKKDRTQLLALSNHAAKKNLIKEFLVLPPMHAPGRLPEAYMEQDIQKLLNAAKTFDGFVADRTEAWFWQTLILTCLETAGRIGEIMSLKWSEVDVENKTVIFLAETRKGKTRDVQRGISATLARLMSANMGNKNEDVFLWDRNHGSLWYYLGQVCQRANVKPRGFHGFRKTAASIVAKHSGVAHAQRLLDHDRSSTTDKHYLDGRIVGLATSVATVLPEFDVSCPVLPETAPKQ